MSAPGLKKTQHFFFDLVRAPEGIEPALDTPQDDGTPSRELLNTLFVGDDRATALERLDIYANMYFFRLRDVLADDFEKTHAVLGAERFHNLITDFLLAHPSSQPSLRWLGQPLADFIAHHQVLELFPFLADLARLEWTWLDVFQAEDGVELDASDLAKIPGEEWPELRFSRAPHVRLLHLSFDVERFFEEELLDPSKITMDPHALLVFRQDEEPVFERMERDSARRLALFFSGRSFGEICEECGEQAIEDAATQTAADLAAWLSKGLFLSPVRL